ncbi:MAG: nuclear transport factor 2 family protein [Rhodocyclaceae bacterium]|nr:nuclear transport factor 2 family protein [Rhodocyclaceae bacterium]
MSPELARLVRFYETLEPGSLATALPSVYADNAGFMDPFNSVVGREAIRAVFAHMFRSLESPRFEVIDTWQTGDTAVIRWTFDFRFRGRPGDVTVEGMSRVVFDREGRVREHVDYWDASSQFYTRLPFVGWIMRLLMRLVAGRN